MIIEPVPQFLFTLIPLLFRPPNFFRTLSDDNTAMDGLQILGLRKKAVPFKSWRRPLTTVGYLFAATLIGAIFGNQIFQILPILH